MPRHNLSETAREVTGLGGTGLPLPKDLSKIAHVSILPSSSSRHSSSGVKLLQESELHTVTTLEMMSAVAEDPLSLCLEAMTQRTQHSQKHLNTYFSEVAMR